jgi:hypothetical protein
VPIPSANSEAEDSTEAAAGERTSAAAAGSGEHTIVVRVYDRFENMGIGKVVVNVPAGR